MKIYLFVLFYGLECFLVGSDDSRECVFVLSGDGFGRWRLHLEGVDRRTVLPDSEIEVRTRACTRAAYITDDLTLLDMLTDSQPLGVLGEMEIGRGISGIMLDLHRMASASLILLESDNTIANRYDWCTHWCRIIHTRMGANNLIYRVLTRIGEMRRDTLVVERCLRNALRRLLPSASK